MKEKLLSIGKNLFPSDKSKGFFLFLAFFCWEGLFDLLCSAQIMKTKMLLDDAAMESNERKVYVFFFLFIFLTFLSMSSNNEKIGIRVLKTVTAIFPFFFMLVVSYRIWNMSYFETDGRIEVSRLILPMILNFLIMLLLTFSLYNAVADVQAGDKKRGLLFNLVKIVRHPFIWIGWGILLIQIVIIPQLLMIPAALYIIPKMQNIMHVLSLSIGFALLETGISYFIIIRMSKRNSEWSQRTIKNDKKGFYLFESFSPIYLVVMVISVVAFIGSIITIPEYETMSDEETVYKGIDEFVQEAYNELYNGHLEEAKLYIDAANTRLDAYLYYLRDEKEKLKDLYEKNQDEPVIAWLYYNQSKDIDSIEQYVITEDPFDRSFHYILLTAYPELKERNMTERRECYREEFLSECILTGEYRVIFPSVLKTGSKGKKTADKLEERYTNLNASKLAIETLLKVEKNGKYSYQIASDIIDESEKYPENAELQYFAGFIGAKSASDDSWRYYSKGLECVKRYLALLEEDKNLSKAEKIEKKLDCAEFMMAMEGYDEAYELLETISGKDARDKADSINIMKLSCLESANRGEDCYKNAGQMIEEGYDDMVVWYYYGVGALKEKNPDKMIIAINHVSDILLGGKLNKEDVLNCNLLLHTMAEFMILNDSGQYTGYQYSMYNELSDVQKDQLSGFSRHYLDALQYYFINRSNDSALDEINAVLEIRDDLPYAIYIRGCIYYNTNKYEEAIEDLTKALESDPDNTTFMYVLSNVYYGAKMYDEALAYSNKVSELLPLLNHKDDWYGVSWHNERLKETIKYYMGR